MRPGAVGCVGRGLRLVRRRLLAVTVAGGVSIARQRRRIADAEAAIAAEHAVVLRVSADFGASPPLPNALESIGIEPAEVGDILLDGTNGRAYVVLSPGAAKSVQRLLGKELSGVVLVEQLAWRHALGPS